MEMLEGVGRVALGGVEEMEMAERGRRERKEEGMREKIGYKVTWCGGCMKDWTCVIYLVVHWLYLMYCTGGKYDPIEL